MRKWCEQREDLGGNRQYPISPALAMFKLIKALSPGKVWEFIMDTDFSKPTVTGNPHHGLIGECNLRDQDKAVTHRAPTAMRNQFIYTSVFPLPGYSLSRYVL